MHLSRNRDFCSRKSGEGGGTHDVSYQGKELWVEGRMGEVDTMEENNMRTTTIDGKTQQHKEKAQLTNSKQVPSLHFSANIRTTLSE